MAFYLPRPPHNSRILKKRLQPITSDYKTQYRFHEPSVQWISEVFLGQENGENRGGALSNKQKLEITFGYMANPGFQHTVSNVVGVSQPTVSLTIKEVVEVINYMQVQTWIHFPSTALEVEQAARLWRASRAFPSAFGVVDGSLIKIQKPWHRYNPSEYFSGRKNSIVSMHRLFAMLSIE